MPWIFSLSIHVNNANHYRKRAATPVGATKEHVFKH